MVLCFGFRIGSPEPKVTRLTRPPCRAGRGVSGGDVSISSGDSPAHLARASISSSQRGGVGSLPSLSPRCICSVSGRVKSCGRKESATCHFFAKREREDFMYYKNFCQDEFDFNFVTTRFFSLLTNQQRQVVAMVLDPCPTLVSTRARLRIRNRPPPSRSN